MSFRPFASQCVRSGGRGADRTGPRLRGLAVVPTRRHSGRLSADVAVVEYDGEQHWTDPAAHAEDITRLDFLAEQGWSIVRVSARHLRDSPADLWRRTEVALRRRGRPGC